jgi:hypothetical protein
MVGGSSTLQPRDVARWSTAAPEFLGTFRGTPLIRDFAVPTFSGGSRCNRPTMAKRKIQTEDSFYIRLKEAFGEWVHVDTSDVQRCKEIIETAKLIFQR